MDFWQECISEAFEDAKIIATQEQVDTVASWAEGAHENYGMSHGYDCIPNPLEDENKELKRELRIERDKILCKECNGSGSITIHGPVHSGTSQCSDCRGDGRRTA